MGSVHALFLSVVWWLAGQAAGSSTATVSGTVIDDTGAPVRLAIVSVGGLGFQTLLATITDDKGFFSLTNVPAGPITLSCLKAAYVSGSFGARRPGEAGTSLTLQPGAVVSGLQLVLTRGAAISGIVRDQNGEPVPGAEVAAVSPAGRDLNKPGLDAVRTDDRGAYRLFGLAPGTYAVVARSTVTGASDFAALSEAEIDQALRELARGQSASPAPQSSATTSLAMAPTFFPSTTDISLAGVVPVAAGDDLRGIDIALSAVRVSTVEGTVTTADGSPLPALRATLEAEGPRVWDQLSDRAAQVDSTGHFRFPRVLPGVYTLMIIANSGSGRPSSMMASTWSRARVETRGDSVVRLTLTLRPGLRLAGRVVFAGTSPPPRDLASLELLATPRDSANRAATTRRVTRLRTDGSFDLGGLLPGRYDLSISPMPGLSWTPRSLVIEGRDVLPDGLELGRDVSGALLSYWDRRTSISGRLLLANNAPAAAYVVVLFPTDRNLWSVGSRRVRVERSSSDGSYSLADLTPGQYRLAVMRELSPPDIEASKFLEDLLPYSMPVTVEEGKEITQDVRIGG